jgi:hypothetical protein
MQLCVPRWLDIPDDLHARAVLENTAPHSRHERHEFWPDDVGYTEVPMTGIMGHRQVTNTYLVQLARSHDGRLATFNQALAKLRPDVALLAPAG